MWCVPGQALPYPPRYDRGPGPQADITIHPNVTIFAASILTAILINVVTQMDYDFRRNTYLFELAARSRRASVDSDGLSYAGRRDGPYVSRLSAESDVSISGWR